MESLEILSGPQLRSGGTLGPRVSEGLERGFWCFAISTSRSTTLIRVGVTTDGVTRNTHLLRAPKIHVVETKPGGFDTTEKLFLGHEISARRRWRAHAPGRELGERLSKLLWSSLRQVLAHL